MTHSEYELATLEERTYLPEISYPAGHKIAIKRDMSDIPEKWFNKVEYPSMYSK